MEVEQTAVKRILDRRVGERITVHLLGRGWVRGTLSDISTYGFDYTVRSGDSVELHFRQREIKRLETKGKRNRLEVWL